MSKNIIFLIIAIIVIAGGWFLLRGNEEPLPNGGAPPAPAAPSGPAAGTEPQPGTGVPQNPPIRYTNAGYEPNVLHVAPGETVTFVNESDGPVWTASGPHPTHTNLPAFDEKQQSGPGTSYTFTFTERGTWRYHNHLNPGHTGTIVVE